jgi:predicted NAD/FAD-binding protein
VSERPEAQSRKRVRVAIVGGGIVGMGAALAFNNSTGSVSFDVDLFEVDTELGGAAKTFQYGGASQEGHMDIAFAAFREYYNFQMLLEALGVQYKSYAGTYTLQ